jgi:hypothetical protein
MSDRTSRFVEYNPDFIKIIESRDSKKEAENGASETADKR